MNSTPRWPAREGAGRARSLYAGRFVCGIQSSSSRRRRFNQPAEQYFVDAPAKADLSVDLDDGNFGVITVLELGVGVDIDAFDFRQVFEISGQHGFGVVAQMTIVSRIDDHSAEAPPGN